MTQADFREAILQMGIRSDRASMDRIYLFFRRYNLVGDDCLSYNDFLQVACPKNPEMAYILKQRPRGATEKEIFDFFTTESFIEMLDCAIETEVQMETIRQ